MIAKLRGLLDSASEDSLIIDVNGVGYLVQASARTLARLPAVGEAVELLIETSVGEDFIRLYGFMEATERDWFRLLTTVQGVGARVGLAILSAAPPAQLAQSIMAGDKAVITRANGVGPKLASRILTELKDKAAKIPAGAMVIGAGATAAGAANGKTANTAAVAAENDGATNDGATNDGATNDGAEIEGAVSALVNLGYGRSDAFVAVGRVAQDLGAGATESALIAGALKQLGKDLGKDLGKNSAKNPGRDRAR